MKDMRLRIGLAIAAMLKEKGVKQQKIVEWARDAGYELSPSAVSRVVNGDARVDLGKIRQVLEVMGQNEFPDQKIRPLLEDLLQARGAEEPVGAEQGIQPVIDPEDLIRQ